MLSSTPSDDEVSSSERVVQEAGTTANDNCSSVENDTNACLSCRYYQEEYPLESSFAMAKVLRIEEVGVYCSLVEYNDVEGLIVKQEVSPKSVMRSIHNHVRIGRLEVVKVVSVDKKKGFIDLTKRRVTPEEVQQHTSYYRKSKAVHGILRHVAKLQKLELQDLYERIAWPLYKTHGHAFNAFQQIVAVEQDDSQDPFESLDIPPDLAEELKGHIRNRWAPKPIKIRSDIDVTCFAMAGIDGIQDALFAGMAVDERVEVKLVVPPTFAISAVVFDEAVGIELVENAIDAVHAAISERGGELRVRMEPRSVTKRQEKGILKDFLEQENDEECYDELLE